MTVTQGGTQTHDLANGLPCSNRVTESPSNSVGEFKYLSLSCQGSSRSGYQAGMFDGEGVANAKCEVQAGAGPMGPYSHHHLHHCRPLSPVVSQ